MAPPAPGTADVFDAAVAWLAAARNAGERRRLLADAIGAVEAARIGEADHAPHAEQLLVRLKAESERYWVTDPHASLALAEALIDGAKLLARPGHEALGVMAKADALRYLGRYPESLELFESAAQAFLTLGDEVGWARTRMGWVVSMQRTGKGAEALEVADRAREILVQHGERLRAGVIDLNAAVVCTYLGRYDRALALYERAQHTCESLGEPGESWVAAAKTNRAVVLTLLGEFDTALRLHGEAREVFERRGATVSVLRNDQNVAYVLAGQGHYTRALRLLVDALETAEQAGLDANATAIGVNVVECYLALNRHAEALDLANRTAARADRSGAPTDGARARFCAALAEARLGNLDGALGLLEDVAQTFERTGMSTELAVSSLERARLHLNAGAWTEAVGAAERARSAFAEKGTTVREAEAALIAARALLGLGGRDEAATTAREALRVLRGRGVDWLAYQSHHVLAEVAQAGGNVRAARQGYAAAIACIESVQSRLTSSMRTNFLDDKLPVYRGAIDCCLEAGDARQALAYLERAKSRALVDYLARNVDVRMRPRDAGDQPLVDELTRLRGEHNWFYSRLYGSGLGPTPDEAEARVLQAGIKDREQRIARLLERLALHADDEPHLAAALGADDEDALPAVGADMVMLEYYFRPDGGAVFVVSDEGVRVVPLVVRPSEIERLLYQWQLNLEAAGRARAAGASLDPLGRNARGILEALYRALVLPVAAHVAGHPRLIVVPYGPTHAVPFHALFDGQRYLLETVEVATCPSMGLLRLCEARPRQGLSALVAAYSDGGRLPHVVEEAAAVAALLPGERLLESDATRQAVVQAAPQHGVLHLAAHGESRLDNPTFAHLKLADGQLSTADVFNLPLEGTLVTLSACETGRSVVTAGDELIGLSRGFLYAGASTLVQSLWRVDDASTAQLMTHFYAALRAGRAKAAALREAQLAAVADGSGHPYLWAPFQLVGDGGIL